MNVTNVTLQFAKIIQKGIIIPVASQDVGVVRVQKVIRHIIVFRALKFINRRMIKMS